MLHPSSLTKDNDQTKTQSSLNLIDEMNKAISSNANNMGDYFSETFCWIGNYGCGKKEGLDHFRTGWQLPLRQAFSDRIYHVEAQFAQGEWVAAFGHIDALHSGTFMGVAPTNQRVIIKFMDIWHVKNGKIMNNWVNVDFPYLLLQLGKDVFDKKGWENAFVADETKK